MEEVPVPKPGPGEVLVKVISFLSSLNLSLVIYQSCLGFIADEWSVDPTKILVKVVFDSSKLRWRQLLSVISFLSSFKLFSDIVLWAFVICL